MDLGGSGEEEFDMNRLGDEVGVAGAGIVDGGGDTAARDEGDRMIIPGRGNGGVSRSLDLTSSPLTSEFFLLPRSPVSTCPGLKHRSRSTIGTRWSLGEE